MTLPAAVLALIEAFPGVVVERTTVAVRDGALALAAERAGMRKGEAA